MASLVQNATGVFSVRFRIGARRFNRSLETTSEKEAKEEKAKIEKTLRLIGEGEKDLPDKATPEQVWVFLHSGGKRTHRVRLAEATSLETVVDEYFLSVPAGAKEESSVKTEHTHAKNLMRHLRASTALYDLDVAQIQRYVTKRQKDKGHHGKAVKADTIQKELQTFRQIWDFAAARGYAAGRCPVDNVVLPKRDERQPFKTWEEIESVINRGGYGDQEQKELWDSLFLRDVEIENLLDYVRGTAAHPFIYPMFCFAAYTGHLFAIPVKRLERGVSFGPIAERVLWFAHAAVRQRLSRNSTSPSMAYARPSGANRSAEDRYRLYGRH